MNTKLIALTMFCFAQVHASEKNDFFALQPKTSAKTGMLTAAAGATAGSATLYGLSWFFNDATDINPHFRVATSAFLPFRWLMMGLGVSQEFQLKTEHPKVVPTLITLASISAGAFAAWLTYRYQPEGKYGRAHKALKKIMTDDVLQDLINAEETLLKNIDCEYIHCAYPRVSACNDLLNYYRSLKKAVELWESAIKQTDDYELIDMAKRCVKMAQEYMINLKKSIDVIRNEPDWVKQLKGYDAMLARKAQQEAAWATQQIAFNTTFR